MKTAVVTGATGSMGLAEVKALAAKGYHVIATYRSESKAKQCQKQLRADEQKAVEWLELEISEPDSICHFASLLADRNSHIDLLLNNAGTLQRHYHKNSQGTELTFATNYLGTKRLTELLLPLITKGGNVVFTSSLSCYVASRKHCQTPLDSSNFSQLRSYANSKMALTHYAQLLAAEHPDLHINCSDPGVVNTPILHMGRWFDSLADLFFRPIIKTAEQGIVPAIRAAESGMTGCLFRGHRKNSYGCSQRGYPRRFLVGG